jgi:NAD/NADP transhydrogenase alpha subunit
MSNLAIGRLADQILADATREKAKLVMAAASRSEKWLAMVATAGDKVPPAARVEAV